MGLPRVSPRAMAKRRFFGHGAFWLVVVVPFFTVLWGVGDSELPYWVVVSTSFGVAAIAGGAFALGGWLIDQAPPRNVDDEKEQRR